MAVKVFTIDMNGGDETSADTAIYFKIYGSADSYTTAIATTGVHGTTGVSVSAGVATVTWEVGTETAFKVTQVDEAGNESLASAEYDTAAATELYTTANAIAKAPNEANATLGVTSSNCTPTVSTNTPAEGTYCILGTGSATDGTFRNLNIAVSGLTIGVSYVISFKARRGAVGTDQRTQGWTGFTSSPAVAITATGTSWQTISETVEASATSGIVKVYSNLLVSGSSNEVYVDEFSVVAV